MEEKEILRYRIKDILKKQGKTLSWLSSEIGVNISTISSGINGRCYIGVKTLIKIAEVLRVEFPDLFSRTGWAGDEFFESITAVDEFNEYLKNNGYTLKSVSVLCYIPMVHLSSMLRGEEKLPSKKAKFMHKKLRIPEDLIEKVFMIEDV